MKTRFSFQTRMQSFTTTAKAGISETFLRMVRHEGILRPVRGMSVMVIGAGPSHAVYFSSYEFLKNIMLQHANNNKFNALIYGKY